MRALALLLLLANALFFGWTHGWLDGVAGSSAHGDREPERLARQVRPEAIRVLSPAAAAASAAGAAADASSAPQVGAPANAAAGASAAAAGVPADTASAAASSAAAAGSARAPALLPSPAAAGGPTAAAAPAARASAAVPAASIAGPPNATAAAVVTSTDPGASTTACLQAGPFTVTEWAAAQAALKSALPAVRATDVAVPRSGSAGGWMVYMGRYADRDTQVRKEEELRRIAVVFEEVGTPPGLGPGLALGRYASRAAAEAALAQFARRGIRTARVVEVAPPVAAHLLRVDRLDAASATALAALRLPAIDRGFSACPAVR